jgi:5-formyltetrahydrofolate cyclo-ligase
LGYGKGFYDAVLGQMAVKSVGLAYEFQVVPALPAESWDQKVKYLMTEKRELKFV